MNDRERTERIDPNPMDRLVDGELSEAERRALLGLLESEPDGWRRCALAFLEAQSWGESLRLLANESVADSAKRRASRPPRRPLSRLSVFNWAAAVLVAFTLGWLVGGGSELRRDGAGRVADQGRAPSADVSRGAGPGGNLGAMEARSEEPTAPGHDPGDDAEALGALLATVSFPDAGDRTEVQVPVYEGPQFSESWLRDQPSALPEYVQRQWERRGYQVLEQRWLYPLELEDGRQVIVPVDEVNVHFVGYEPL